MTHRPKKKKQAARHLDFVTDLTPDECRDLLDLEPGQYIGEGSEIAGCGDDGQLWVERTVDFEYLLPMPVRFEGVVREGTESTHIKGQITHDTMRRIHQFGGRMLLAVAAYVLVGGSIINLLESYAGWRAFLWLVLGYGVSIGGLILLAMYFDIRQNCKRYGSDLVWWLFEQLDLPPELPLTDAAASEVVPISPPLPLCLDFVTALSPAECCDLLHHATQAYSGRGRQRVGWDDTGTFWVERTRWMELFKLPPLRFEGTLTPHAAGTRLQGGITVETMRRIRRTLHRRRIVSYLMISGVEFLAVLISLSLGFLAPWSWALFLSLMFVGVSSPVVWLTLVGTRPPGIVTIDHVSEPVVQWVHQHVYVPPHGVTPTEDEEALPAEIEACLAAEAEQRDHAHSA